MSTVRTRDPVNQNTPCVLSDWICNCVTYCNPCQLYIIEA